MHLVCSVGIARSKTYAKLASDLQKPNGLAIIYDKEDEKQRIHPLDLDEVWGIGNRLYEKLCSKGLKTIKDGIERGYPPFRSSLASTLARSFGKW